MGKIDIYNRINYLVDILNEYTKLYDEGHPAISDREWDDLYFELKELEKQQPQWIRKDSPTQFISYQVVSKLKKVAHDHPMLSLDKTKSEEEIRAFANKADCVAMLKLDGLSCSLRYENGKLVRAETRGLDGQIGEDITHNALVIQSIPNKINTKTTFVVDGEIVCKKSDFEPFAKEYKVSRNFAAGSARLLDNKECERRHLSFVSWECIEPKYDTLINGFVALSDLGFDVVPWTVWTDNLSLNKYEEWLGDVKEYPTDGLVFKYNNTAYRESLGRTQHHFNGGFAFKFYDESVSSTLLDIDYDVSRNGILTPVAVFDPIEIDGSEVSRASLHNLSIMKQTLGTPYEGEQIEVSKRNQIIPQIEWADKGNIDNHKVFITPKICPICGGETKVVDDVLYCTNPQCSGRIINRLDHMFGKKGLDIKGLSVNTFDKLLDWGWIKEPADVFNLAEHRAKWIEKSGFGEKSVDNILKAIEVGRHQTLEKFIVAIGIPNIGTAQAKEICSAICSYEGFKTYAYWDALDGFGPSRSAAINNFDFKEADEVYKHLIFEEKNDKIYIENKNELKDKVFVITGSVHHWANRNELKAFIESKGGKVASAVSGKTDYLINNDYTSATAKNVKAKELGVPIISEEHFLEILKNS